MPLVAQRDPFPNHYTLVTGLHPDHHGIVPNRFFDAELGALTMASKETGWLAMTRDRAVTRAGGAHGYDNQASEMQAVFIARGPGVVAGRRLSDQDRVDAQPFLARMLDLPAPACGGRPRTPCRSPDADRPQSGRMTMQVTRRSARASQAVLAAISVSPVKRARYQSPAARTLRSALANWDRKRRLTAVNQSLATFSSRKLTPARAQAS